MGINEEGFGICRKPNSKTKRVHYSEEVDKAPKKDEVISYCYSGPRLKTLKEQKK